MYIKSSQSGQKVVWKPKNQKLAEQAMEEHKGQGVPEHVTLPDDASVPVGADTARAIRHTYRTLVLDRDIRAALDAAEDAEDEETEEEHLAEAEELQERYKDHTGEEWEE